MAQLSHGSRFAPKTVTKHRVVYVLLVHDFGGHFASETRVNAAINRRHAAARDRAVDDIPVFELVSRC